jgi:hypothetical protein
VSEVRSVPLLHCYQPLPVFLNDSRNILFKMNFSIRNTDVTLDNTKWIRWPSKYWCCFCSRISLPVKPTRWDFQLLCQRLCLLQKSLSLACFKMWRWKNWLNFRLWFFRVVFLSTSETLWFFSLEIFFPVRFTAIDIVLSKRLNSSYILPKVQRTFMFPLLHKETKQQTKK